MQHFEYKIREINREWVEKVLQDYDFKKTFEGEVFTTYFDSADKKFLQSGKRLSVKSKGDKHTITYRDPYKEVGFGVSDEFEVEVSEPYLMSKIIEELGFHEFKTFKKFRVDYHVENVILSFDKYLEEFSYVPEFLMLESDSEDAIFTWAERLGYTRDECEAISVLELIKKYKPK